MGSESIQVASATVFKQTDGGAIRQTFTADGNLVAGQPVKLSGANEVVAAAVADEHIGFVEVGGLDGELITVRLTAFDAIAQVVMIGGTSSIGQKLNYNGTIASNGLPQVIAAATTTKAKAVALSVGATTTTIVVGLLKQPFTMP